MSERLHPNCSWCELEHLPSLLPNSQPPGRDEPGRKGVNASRICRTLWLPQPNGNGYDAEALWRAKPRNYNLRWGKHDNNSCGCLLEGEHYGKNC